MQPDEINRLFEKKKAEIASAKRQQEESDNAKARELQESTKAAQTALDGVVLPYLQEIKKVIGPDFTCGPGAAMADTALPMSVWFQFKNNDRYTIDVHHAGRISVKSASPNVGGPLGGSASRSDISSAADLTREKLAGLIADAIEDLR